MALHADTQWEFRADGNNDNGGGFYDRDPGTSVDYSQQEAAQLSLTDLATDGGGTGLSSATGGFTDAMVGNVIYIKSGTGFTPGWYEITAYSDGNNVTIDRSAGASASSGSGKVGGARAVPTDAFFEALTAGNKIWFEAGTYNFSETIALAKDGTTAVTFEIEGYNASRGDKPIGDNRPLFAMGAYYFELGQWWRVKHIRATGAHASYVWRGDYHCFFRNCKAQNTGNGVAFSSYGSGFRYIDCEGIAGNSSAFDGNYGSNAYVGCYAHDSVIGFDIGVRANDTIMFCIADTCTTGIKLTGTGGHIVVNNTVYNCTTGIDGQVCYECDVLNNIVSGCTTGISWTSEFTSNTFDYNNFYDCDTDVSNITGGANDTDYNPQFTDADNGDFSLNSASDCIGAGYSTRLGIS